MVATMLIDVAELAGMLAEGPLFGIFFVLDIVAIHILVRRRKYAPLHIPMLAASVIMMALAIAQYSVDSVNIFQAFIGLAKEPRAARFVFFKNVTLPIYAARHAIYFTMMIVGDAIVIYRCYVVWGSRLLIVLVPILCSLGSAVCAYQTIGAITNHPVFNKAFITLEHDMGFALFGLSFAANAIATSLLAFKIWQADKELKQAMSLPQMKSSSKLHIIRIVVESGAINTAYLLAYTLVLQSGSSAVQIMASIVTPIVGIIFSMVIIRVAIASEERARSMANSAGIQLTSITRRDDGSNAFSRSQTTQISQTITKEIPLDRMDSV